MIDGTTMILVGCAVQLVPAIAGAAARVRGRRELRAGLAALGMAMLPPRDRGLEAVLLRGGIPAERIDGN